MKKSQADLFSDSAPSSLGVALHLNVKANRPSAAQQRFNRLLARIDKLKGEVAQIQALANTYRPLYASTLMPLREQQASSMRRMALWLDERLARKGLTAAQKRSVIEILCALCETLAAGGDEAMAALHDKHSPRSLRQKEEDEAAEMRAMMKGVLGDRLDVDLEDESLDPMERMEALMRASREHHDEEVKARQEQREAARARKKPSAAQLKAEQQQHNAEIVLRQVYRQLASALHPDRERDPAEHRRKTALMSEVNAAYARQDLVALLHLRQTIVQADTQALLEQPEEKIAAMSLLLKKQADELERELAVRQGQVQDEFDLAFYLPPTAETLRMELQLQQDALRDDLEQMENDLSDVQDDAGFKRWLKLQKQLAKQVDYF